eukprot:Tbor_TRINITY_DN5966_c3_g3::TRINITY_DN5966_c3_g3_i4::g.18360::m.18360/K06170/PSENEN, PEN2; presenilin enhancer 2
MFAPRLTPESATRISKIYFLLGFLLLPWLWALNIITFYPYTNNTNMTELKRNIKLSAIFIIPVFIIFIIISLIIRFVLMDVNNIWIIRPGVRGNQGGYFASSVYNSIDF